MSKQGAIVDTRTKESAVSAVERKRGSFSTNRLEFNSAGKRVVAYLDFSEENSAPLGVVLIAPAYGETKENNLLVSAYLVANGFYALRFDWTDHVGESEGEIYKSTLSEMGQDLLGLLNYVEKRFASTKIGILATSLAARVALKVVASERRPNFLICFAPVVNLKETLRTVYREDLINGYSRGKRYGTLDVLGFSIDADNFLGDAIEKGFSDLCRSKEDASKIVIPTLFLAGQRDSWVQMSDTLAVFEVIHTTDKKFLPLSTGMHRLQENPMATRDAFRSTVRCILNFVNANKMTIDEPHPEEIQAREAEEKAHLKDVYRYSRADEKEFWREYLNNFQYIINIHDYYSLLEFVYDHLGGAWAGQKILDAGCGNGNYGLFLLTKQMYRLHQNSQNLYAAPIRYFGIDFIWDAIREASHKIRHLQEEFEKQRGLLSGGNDFIEDRFLAADLEAGVPFPDNYFDQVSCNLVISYLQEPKKVLRELCRVLRPGGKMVVSSLKPNADLSEIYRNFISVAESAEEIEEGRKLLSNAGMIKLKEVRGVYHFYSEKELKEVTRQAGFIRARALRSFGNQANVVVCSKMQ
jgi:ubiquinone/menaquinone biosynthesis C-methylase UbiE/alpha-beta hydrolase superfamily lysophospholipase